jgi:hypothetical protein
VKKRSFRGGRSAGTEPPRNQAATDGPVVL